MPDSAPNGVLGPQDDVYLRSFLAPLAPWLARTDITDILINNPGEVWIETNQSPTMELHKVPELTATALNRLATQVARTNHQGLNRAHPILGGRLLNGERIQIVAPPATRQHIAIAIRKYLPANMSLQDYAASGAFARVKHKVDSAANAGDTQLQQMLDSDNILAFFETAVALRKNFLISGGTSSGKTTFLNALLKHVDTNARVIAIEDTPEVSLNIANSLGLVAVRNELGEAEVGIEELLEASLRMRPDRLLLGELRGKEAFSFLRAVNTGHPGSITTVHADHPEGALEQVALMALQARVNLGRSEVVSYVRSVVDVVVQLRRESGLRVVSEILFNRPTGKAHSV